MVRHYFSTVRRILDFIAPKNQKKTKQSLRGKRKRGVGEGPEGTVTSVVASHSDGTVDGTGEIYEDLKRN